MKFFKNHWFGLVAVFVIAFLLWETIKVFTGVVQGTVSSVESVIFAPLNTLKTLFNGIASWFSGGTNNNSNDSASIQGLSQDQSGGFFTNTAQLPTTNNWGLPNVNTDLNQVD